jgi:hypothetical protein
VFVGVRPLRGIAHAPARGIFALGLSSVAFACTGCPNPATNKADSTPQVQAKPADPFEVAERVYEGQLTPGWTASGTATWQAAPGGAAAIRFGDSGEWVLSKSGLTGPFGGVAFTVKEPVGEGEFLELRVASGDGRKRLGVKLKPDHRTELADGWVQVLVPMSELNPDGAPFDRIVLRPFRPVPAEGVLVDKVALTKQTSSPAVGQAASRPAAASKTAHVRVECDGKTAKISPYIYGIAFGEKTWPSLKPAARRWGGNGTTRYNWETHFSNSGSDWFFENHGGSTYAEFLAESAAHDTLSAVTIPILGWVAKDGTSYSFPISAFGPQSRVDPWHPDIGSGEDPSHKPIAPGPATRTSVAAPPDWAKRWVTAIHATEAKTGKRSVYEYILDNEPGLWNTTHRDVHPEPVSYDELLDRTIQYATAIRDADPEALIAGPAEWGWSGYLFSAKDLAGHGLHTDRRAHDDVPLVEWYLRKLREHEQKTGKRLLDVFDLHYYPQGSNVYAGGAGGTDRETQLLRLRSTRSLWDPSYVDESWIKEPVRLLPRMKEWVDKAYPGRAISIGEWNFGGEKDVTGALATAETLGRFAQYGITSAFYWTAPAPDSQSTFGFLAYRNFDGHGGRFLDWYVPTSPATAPDGISVFASRDDERKHMVLVVINMSPDASTEANIDVGSCGAIASQQAYAYAKNGSGFAPVDPSQGTGSALVRTVAPWSITVIDTHLR